MFTSYTTPIPDKIASLMEAAFGTIFKSYYVTGDPIYIPEQNLPCLILDVESQSFPGQAPTGMMRLIHTITIQAEFDKRPEFNKNPKEVYLKKTLQQIATGIDPQTGEIGEQTIVGVLQRHFTLGNQATGQELTVAYPLMPRGQQLLTQAVVVTATIREDRVLSERV